MGALAEGMVAKELSAIAGSKAAKKLIQAEVGALAAERVTAKLGAMTATFSNNVRQEGVSIYGDAVEQGEKNGKPVDLRLVWAATLAIGRNTAGHRSFTPR